MERQKNINIDREVWHKAMNTRLARLAVEMCEAFNYSPDAVQTVEYVAIQAEYLDLQTVRAEHDRSDETRQFTGRRG